ncbi:hypothetical protein VSQ48_18380 [Candidatus Ventrimonas sp. KK005]
MLNDVVEVGAVNYIYQKTAWMRSRLHKYFPLRIYYGDCYAVEAILSLIYAALRALK